MKKQVKNIRTEEKKTLHRFRARAIEMILNDIEKNGFASVFYPYNFVKDIKEHYGIDVKVDGSLRIVYNK